MFDEKYRKGMKKINPSDELINSTAEKISQSLVAAKRHTSKHFVSIVAAVVLATATGITALAYGISGADWFKNNYNSDENSVIDSYVNVNQLDSMASEFAPISISDDDISIEVLGAVGTPESMKVSFLVTYKGEESILGDNSRSDLMFKYSIVDSGGDHHCSGEIITSRTDPSLNPNQFIQIWTMSFEPDPNREEIIFTFENFVYLNFDNSEITILLDKTYSLSVPVAGNSDNSKTKTAVVNEEMHQVFVEKVEITPLGINVTYSNDTAADTTEQWYNAEFIVRLTTDENYGLVFDDGKILSFAEFATEGYMVSSSGIDVFIKEILAISTDAPIDVSRIKAVRLGDIEIAVE